MGIEELVLSYCPHFPMGCVGALSMLHQNMPNHVPVYMMS